MPKIGILGCDVTTRDMDCVMIGCFGNLHGRQGEFEQYSTVVLILLKIIILFPSEI